MEILLEFKGVAIGRETTLINSIYCSLPAGKLVLLTGINGSGKSSLLKSLAGILPIKGGTITIQNKVLSSLSREERSNLLSYAGTERIYEDYITIEDLVRFGRYPYSEDLKVESNAVEISMKQMGIFELKNKSLDKVSDGEWQKANVARALAQDTPIVLLDEPSAFLDYPSRKRLFSDLKSICTTHNKSMIVSTHDIEIAQNSADIFWHIDKNTLSESFLPPIWDFEL